MRPLLVLPVLLVLLACGGGAAARPTPGPTATAAPTATPAPTPTPEEAVRLAVEGLGPPLGRSAPPVVVERTDMGGGPRLVVTMPLAERGTPEQVVRQGRLRMINAIVEALKVEDVAEVNVVGTLPVGGSEAPAISVVVTRAAWASWDGTVEGAPGGWQVSGRLE